jgi:coiled-coil domain-containing protein 55
LREEKEHEVLVKAAKGEIELPTTAEGEVQEKSAEELAKEINAMGGNVLVNEDGEVVDKRQLLKGGLNVSAKKQAELERERERKRAAEEAAERARREAREREARNRAVYAEGGKRAMLERQARMLEQQLEESRKRAREEAEQEAARLQMSTKSRKTEAEISSARERYLARKRAAEEAKKNGQAELP